MKNYVYAPFYFNRVKAKDIDSKSTSQYTYSV